MNFLYFFFQIILSFFPSLKKPSLIVHHINFLTVSSIPLTLLVSAFTGAIIVVQSITHIGSLVPLQYIGIAVQKSVLIDLGPVLTAIVVAGKISGSIASEIGSMSISEQINVFKTNSLNPFQYLIVPRIIAGCISLPILTIFSASIAILVTLGITVLFYDLSNSSFIVGLRLFYENKDTLISLIKSLYFGFCIAACGCYFGYFCIGSGENVGKNSKLAVTSAHILILFGSYFISFIFL